MKKLVVIVILTLCTIFFLSRMTYEQQTIVPELSKLLEDEPFKEQLSKIKLTYWNQTISIETRGYIYFIEFLIRKATHFSGYGIVGIILYLFYFRLKWRPAPLLAIFSVFILGSIDEYIQYHIPGRTGIFDDVIIDTCGAILFVSIFSLIHQIILKMKRKKKKKK